MDEKLQKYLAAHRKKKLYQVLKQAWTEIQKPSKKYLVLNKNATWGIQIYAIYEQGIAIYHEVRDGRKD
jgi:hypothetical protein